MKTGKKLFHVQGTDRRISMIAQHYGVTHQLNKTLEELFELFITIVVKPPHLWGGYKTAIQRIAIDQ